MDLGSFKPAGKRFGQNNTTELFMIIKVNIYSKDKGVVWGQVSWQSIFRLAEDYKTALYNKPGTNHLFLLAIMK